jgi:hypothetical protein
VYVIGVAKKYISSHSKNHPRAKKYPFVYLIDDNWKIYAKRISTWQMPFYNALKHYRVIRYCQECGMKFKVLVRKKNQKLMCPICQ